MTDSNLNIELIKAVLANDLTAVKAALEKGADANSPHAIGTLTTPEENRGTALIIAAGNGQPEICKCLLDAGADVNKTYINRKFRRDHTAIYKGVESGDLETVRLLHKAGADLNSTFNGRETLLMKAAEHDNAKVAEYLLDNGVDINSKNSSQYTALIVAMENQSAETVKLLMDRGDKEIKTWHLYNSIGRLDVETGDETALIEILKLLIAAGAEVNPKEGALPIVEAVYKNRPALVKFLIEAGARADYKGKHSQGDTAIDAAIKYERAAIIECFKENLNEKELKKLHKALGNAESPDGQLLDAISKCDQEKVEAALAAGADPNVKKGKKSAYKMAMADSGFWEIRCMLIEAGCNDPKFFEHA